MIREAEQIEKEELKNSAEEYALCMLDSTGCVISCNKGAEQIKGFKAKEIIGQYISVFYSADQIEKGEPQRNLEKARQLGQFESEGWRVKKDGSTYWANEVFTAMKDGGNKIVGYGLVTRDKTQRAGAEKEIERLHTSLEKQLQKSRLEVQDYKHAIDESSIVAITDQKGIIKYVNNNFCKISKYSVEELIGQDHRLINSGYHSKELIRNLWVTIANGKIWRGELKNRAKDGSFYWVDTTIVPFLNEKGKPYQYMAIRADITPRKLAEEHIIKINEELENKVRERTFELTEALEREKELNEMKSRFVSMASHEFRTPLSAILSSVGLVDHYKSPEQDEKRHKHIERIKSSVRNLTDILNDFLSLDKLEQGKVEAKATHFNLHDLIVDIVEEMEGMLKKKSQKICLVDNGPSEVFQDKKVLRNVLLNLLSNAIKYSPEEKEIYVTVVASDYQVSISIRDEGIGIPLDAQKNLFDKFFRANNATNIQGTGLGLNIVKKYVELLNGSIQFSSTENIGSTFTVEFPQYAIS